MILSNGAMNMETRPSDLFFAMCPWCPDPSRARTNNDVPGPVLFVSSPRYVRPSVTIVVWRWCPVLNGGPDRFLSPIEPLSNVPSAAKQIDGCEALRECSVCGCLSCPPRSIDPCRYFTNGLTGRGSNGHRKSKSSERSTSPRLLLIEPEQCRMLHVQAAPQHHARYERASPEGRTRAASDGWEERCGTGSSCCCKQTLGVIRTHEQVAISCRQISNARRSSVFFMSPSESTEAPSMRERSNLRTTKSPPPPAILSIDCAHENCIRL